MKAFSHRETPLLSREKILAKTKCFQRLNTRTTTFLVSCRRVVCCPSLKSPTLTVFRTVFKVNILSPTSHFLPKNYKPRTSDRRVQVCLFRITFFLRRKQLNVTLTRLSKSRDALHLPIWRFSNKKNV